MTDPLLRSLLRPLLPAVALLPFTAGCGDEPDVPDPHIPQPTVLSTATASPPTPASPLATERATVDDRQPQSLPTTTMRLGQLPFLLQIADDEEERNKGLMWVREMPGNEGMIFVFPEPRPLSFWMKNTYIPLDIIFVAEDGRVLNVEQMRPHDRRGTPSAGLAKWAIELNRGMAAKAGVTRGTTLAIPPEAGGPDDE